MERPSTQPKVEGRFDADLPVAGEDGAPGPSVPESADGPDVGREAASDSTLPRLAVQLARDLLHNQARAIVSVADSLNAGFAGAVDLIASCSNRLIVTGVGKSGFVARQIAATFVRTGLPSFFLHPTDAAHGDLGAIAGDDLILLVSSSGRTEELLNLVPHLRRRCRSILAIVGARESPLGVQADLALEVAVADDPLVAGPISASLAALALADALAVSVMQQRGLPREVLLQNHPGGSRGTGQPSNIVEGVLSLPKGRGVGEPLP